ncbi:DMT family transporter [Actinokineospora pegani]|uniref:DMT family transporter n=1 Tax=Actinokineospora pegani TaxID=2654637 RepID=UPI0012EA58F9|nr:DMT family transporter [Actinokineospora pegani]
MRSLSRERATKWPAVGVVGFPVLFVAVWSSGFIVGAIGTREAAPAALGFWRFLLAALVMGAVVLVSRAPLPRGRVVWWHLFVTGALLQTVQFAGVFIAMGLGLAAGLTSLVTDATPLVVAVAAVPLFGERLTGWQVVGLALGTGGVVAAVGADLEGSVTAGGVVAAVVGLVGSAGGTLYQKRFGADMDMRSGMLVQLVAAVVTIAPLAALTGGFGIPWTVGAVGAVVWSALVGSIAAFVLLFVLLRHRPGAGATSYLFLVPPVTALAGVPLLGQPVSLGAVAGFALAAAGVALVTRAASSPRRLP